MGGAAFDRAGSLASLDAMNGLVKGILIAVGASFIVSRLQQQPQQNGSSNSLANALNALNSGIAKLLNSQKQQQSAPKGSGGGSSGFGGGGGGVGGGAPSFAGTDPVVDADPIWLQPPSPVPGPLPPDDPTAGDPTFGTGVNGFVPGGDDWTQDPGIQTLNDLPIATPPVIGPDSTDESFPPFDDGGDLGDASSFTGEDPSADDFSDF